MLRGRLRGILIGVRGVGRGGIRGIEWKICRYDESEDSVGSSIVLFFGVVIHWPKQLNIKTLQDKTRTRTFLIVVHIVANTFSRSPRVLQTDTRPRRPLRCRLAT